jgi:eukaryotic-like serine/threonine-protein kinase
MESPVTSPFLGSDCVGRIIDGRFTLLRWLGGTEQSSVFETKLEGDAAQKAAVKFTPANAADAETRMARWATDKTLSHPHLMRIFHSGRCKVDSVELLYVVTDYADEVLSEILRERALTPAEAREMLAPVLDALSSLHGRKLVHGRLKPSNILVVDDQLKLSTDRLHAAGEPGRSAAWSGKYDAPEAALERMAPAADVWSLGVVLVEALTRKRPHWDRFGGADPAVPASIPPPLFAIAQECLRVDPARRATLSAIQDSLTAAPPTEPSARIPEAAPSRATSPRALLSKAMPSKEALSRALPSRETLSRALPSRALLSRTPILIAGAVLLAGVIITALVLGSHHPPSPPAVSQSPAPATQPQPQPPPPAPESPRVPAQPHHGSLLKGAVADQVIPDVPQHIMDTVQGHFSVRIAVDVDSSGHVADATVDAQGPSRYFANQALQAARNWTFRPAQTDGGAVASQWILEFHFAQDGITASPRETSP